MRERSVNPRSLTGRVPCMSRPARLFCWHPASSPIWKGKREERLELAVIDSVAERLSFGRWDVFTMLDRLFERSPPMSQGDSSVPASRESAALRRWRRWRRWRRARLAHSVPHESGLPRMSAQRPPKAVMSAQQCAHSGSYVCIALAGVGLELRLMSARFRRSAIREHVCLHGFGFRRSFGDALAWWRLPSCRVYVRRASRI
jgi:hypothetical protein